VFIRKISLKGPLSDEQTRRLLQIADRCPVHRTLSGEAEIETALDETEPSAVDRATQHVLDSRESLIEADDGPARPSLTPTR
jgi:putative redox protein